MQSIYLSYTLYLFYLYFKEILLPYITFIFYIKQAILQYLFNKYIIKKNSIMLKVYILNIHFLLTITLKSKLGYYSIDYTYIWYMLSIYQIYVYWFYIKQAARQYPLSICLVYAKYIHHNIYLLFQVRYTMVSVYVKHILSIYTS